MTEPTIPETVDVETLAAWLVCTPRRVQQLEKKGITFKDEHGDWRLRDSVQGRIRDLDARFDAKNSEYHKHRTRKVKTDADRAEIEKLERLGLLVNAGAYLRAREKKDSDIKQRLLNFEKILPQKLGGLSADAMVPIIRNEIRKLLTEIASTEKPLGSDRAGRQDLPAPAGPNPVPVGGPAAQTQQ